MKMCLTIREGVKKIDMSDMKSRLFSEKVFKNILHSLNFFLFVKMFDMYMYKKRRKMTNLNFFVC